MKPPIVRLAAEELLDADPEVLLAQAGDRHVDRYDERREACRLRARDASKRHVAATPQVELYQHVPLEAAFTSSSRVPDKVERM